MCPLDNIEDVQEELLKDKPLLVLKDNDSVEIIPITPVRKEVSRFNAGVTQYRVVVFIPASKTLRQFILSKQRFMRLNNLIGDWSKQNNACLVRVKRNGEGVTSTYSFELVKTDNETRTQYYNALQELTSIDIEEGWEDFIDWAKELIKPVGKAKETKAKDKSKEEAKE